MFYEPRYDVSCHWIVLIGINKVDRANNWEVWHTSFERFASLRGAWDNPEWNFQDLSRLARCIWGRSAPNGWAAWRRTPSAAARHAPSMDTSGRNGRSGDTFTMLESVWNRDGSWYIQVSGGSVASGVALNRDIVVLCCSFFPLRGACLHFYPRRFSHRMLMILDSRVRS